MSSTNNTKMQPRKFKHFEYLPIKSPTEKKAQSDDETWDHSDIEASDDEQIPHRGTTDFIQKSTWQSDRFKVQRTAQAASWQHSDYYRYRIFMTTKWIIVPIFLLFGIATIIVSVLYFVHDIAKSIGFAIILSINIIGGLLGAVMVYKYGTVEQVINFMTLQNQWYETQMDTLTKHRKKIGKEAKYIHFSVNKLKSISKDLDEQYQNFESLRKELEEICKENETLKEKLDAVNEICNDLLVAIKKNEKAHLLSIYYHLCTNRHQDHLTKKDYKQFLGRLNKATREEIEKQGGFQAMDKNNDGLVDVHEFQDLINTVLEITEEEEVKLLKRLTQLNYGESMGHIQ